MTWPPASALWGSTVVEEARQRGVLGSRLDFEGHPALQTKALWQDGAIQAALCRGGVPLAPPADQPAALLIERLWVKAP
jgi:hypothetical protein